MNGVGACRIPYSGFDVPATAGLYSQTCGVLAGFAFAAILLLLTADPHTRLSVSDHEVDHGVTAFVCAFFGLILSTVEYAVLAGEPTNSGRATLEELFFGVGFGLSALLLLYGLLHLLGISGNFRGSSGVTSAITGIFGPFVVMSFLVSGVGDVSAYRSGHEPATAHAVPCDWTMTPHLRFAWGLFICAALYLLVIFGIRRRAEAPQSRFLAKRLNNLPHYVVAFDIAVAFGAAVIAAIVPAAFVTPLWLEMIILVLGTGTILMFSSLIVLGGQAPGPGLSEISP